MVKRENTNFFVPASWVAPRSPPDAPPGFPPKPPLFCAPPASADTPGNHNPTSVMGTVGGGAYRDGSVSPERLTQLTSQLPCKETEIVNPNMVSSIPSQEQSYEDDFDPTQGGEGQQPQRSRMAAGGGQGLRSDVFIRHFTKVPDEKRSDKHFLCICNHCPPNAKKKYAFKTGGGYGSMQRHIRIHHSAKMGIPTTQTQFATRTGLRSNIFTRHFMKVPDEKKSDKHFICICNHCPPNAKKKYAFKTGDGYGSMQRHIRIHHPAEMGIPTTQKQFPKSSTASATRTACNETETVNPNLASSIPSQKLQEHSSCFCFTIKSPQTSKELSSSDTESQLVEDDLQAHFPPSNPHSLDRKVNMKRETHDIGVSENQDGATNRSPFQTHGVFDITLTKSPVYERFGSVGPKILHVASALNDSEVDLAHSYYTAVRDAENMKVNMKWLRDRLDEIRDAVELTEEEKVLANEKDARLANIFMKKKELEMRKVELENIKSEVEDLEACLAREVVMVEELNRTIGARQSRFSKFQHKYLMEGLI
ncbi:Unknown protein [Striga hermonthica]|uniref:Uncharacterized protein n=1 Tax=Striga hermonthica TaxID=68872 RepID=A0A9N7RHY3_STRHE|nr:Unknown protein [Striga hermonthica]